MTFSQANPLVGQQFTLTVTSARNLSNVRITGSHSEDRQTGPTARTDGGNFEWDWQITPGSAGRRDYYFYVQTNTLCTTNFIVFVAPPTPTVTRVPTPTPSPILVPTNTFTPTATPCPRFANPVIVAGNVNAAVTITWRSTGGCAPYSGTITAQYNGAPRTGPTSRSIPISSASGTTSDTPPPGCYPSITYTLNLKDNSGQSVSASQQIVWCGG